MNKSNKSLIINGLVALALCFGIWVIPPVAPLTVVGMHTLGVFVGLIYGLTSIGYLVPSIVALFLMGISGAYAAFSGAFIAGFGNHIITMTIGLFMFAGVMSYSGLARSIALRIVNAKFASGKPWALTFVIMLAIGIPSIFLHPLITVVLVLEIVINIFKVLGLEKGNKWAVSIMIMVVTIGIGAQGIMPFQMAVAMDYGIINGFDSSLLLPVGVHVGTSFLMLVALFVLCYGFIYFVGRNDISKVYSYKAPEHNDSLDDNQKKALWILIGFVGCLLLPVVLPDSALKSTLTGIGTTGFSFLFVAIALMIRNKDGSSFIEMKNISDHGVNWNIILMLAAISAVTGVMTAEVTGVGAWMSGLLTPMVANMSPFGVFAVFIVFAMIATNLTDCIAVAFVMIPILFTVTNNLGLSSLGFLCWASHAWQFGLWLPAASPHVGILYAKTDSGYVSRKNIILYTIPLIIGYTILLLTIGWWTVPFFP